MNWTTLKKVKDRLWNNALIRNKEGQIRSGYIILFTFAVFYLLAYLFQWLVIEILTKILIATGDINTVTGELSPFVDWLNVSVLPIVFQISMDLLMIAVPLFVFLRMMKQPLRDLGLTSFKRGRKELFLGMLMGACFCSVIFLFLFATHKVQILSWTPRPSMEQLGYLIAMVFIATGEELLNRGFIMAVLRRTKNKVFIMLVPSVCFGLIHLFNPNVTAISILNIILIGFVFSLMFYWSGNLWMCMGYHFTWNVFQSIIYGMPASGLNIEGLMHTKLVGSHLLTGGAFGIEGGLLTTLSSVVAFGFVAVYYRNSTYHFLTKE